LFKGKLIVASIATVLLAACAAPPRYMWMKDGVSTDGVDTAQSECNYQIKLNKTPQAQQNELRNLCMNGKGFRLKRVN
jgi:uncharacterized lipoprotein YajG